MLSCENVAQFKMSRTSHQEHESFLETSSPSCAEDDFDEDTRCGFGFIRGKFIQKLASKKSFLVVHALTGMMYNASFHYYSGTLTTLEKHYKFSSTQIAYFGAAYDIVATVVSLIAPYYCSKGRIPRWMGFAIFCFGFSFMIFILPFVFYGAGSDALALTEEFGSSFNPNSTYELLHQMKMKELCYENKTLENCSEESASNKYSIVALLFIISNGIAGFGGAIYSTLGATYIDDNVKKSKAPMLLCISSFVRLLAPAIGYTMASYFLKLYVAPDLHPKITDEDPRWIGAWWIGYFVFGVVMMIAAPIICTFPKILPRAALRKKQEEANVKSNIDSNRAKDVKKNFASSVQELLQAFKRLLTNKTYVCNTLAAVFYCFGYIPFFFFQAKYIQIHFLFSASTANMITGTVSLIFAAIGLLTAGIVITLFKPSARQLAMWNVVSSIISVIGVIAYGYFSCTAESNSLMMANSQNFSSCNENCNCDFVQYAPVCGENHVTYISSCHAGCTEEITLRNETKTFTNCRCINSSSSENSGGSAIAGACPIDCMPKFIVFLIILCLEKFIGGTEGTANFLLGIRCIEKRDKAISMGLSTAIISLFAIVPSPIFFGWIIDRSCLFWGKTCSKQGNCWLYDANEMKYSLNNIAAAFIFIGTLWDVGTWYYSKDVQIFDKEEKEEEAAIELAQSPSKIRNDMQKLKK